MIINMGKNDVVCKKCGHPFFEAVKNYSFSKDTYSKGHVIACNFVVTKIKCAKCGEILDEVYDNVEIVKP